MLCPKCQEENKKSKVYNGCTFCTAVYYRPYYDEEGTYHNHDANKRTTSYSCSNGHRFSVTDYGSCRCGWGGGEVKTEIQEPFSVKET